MKGLRLIVCLAVLLGTPNCNTENQGSTPADTEIKGTIAGNPAPASLRTISGTVEWPPPTLQTIGRDEAVCDLSRPVALVLEDADGRQSSWDFAGEAFEFEVETNQTYRLFLAQDETRCGELHYTATQSWGGLKTVLGNGDEDVELGELFIYDIGLIHAANDPGLFTDHDGDGITDHLDPDADGDGLPDTDLDYDGLIDWAQADLAPGEDTPAADTCDILFMHPSHRSALLVPRATRQGEIVLHVSAEVAAIEARSMRLLDQDDRPVPAPFVKTWIAKTPKGPAVAIQTIPLALDARYTLVVPPGSFSCQGGGEFENDLEIEFIPHPYFGP